MVYIFMLGQESFKFTAPNSLLLVLQMFLEQKNLR